MSPMQWAGVVKCAPSAWGTAVATMYYVVMSHDGTGTVTTAQPGTDTAARGGEAGRVMILTYCFTGMIGGRFGLRP